jgi:SET domain-containing protein
MTKKGIINSIYNNCNVRLKPSKVCDGVGVFAIKPIKSGEILFKDVEPDSTYIKFSEIKGVGDSVLEYLKSMCNSDDEGLFLSRTVSNINISYFINHSNNPNVEHDLILDVYKTIKDIGIGEELVCLYNKNEKNGF